ncbi:LOW QUALITY PROTEIN: BTB/POZ domain-containing protein At1g03010-like [Phalaenopsis equestris]|uniref:LOW QUALITY PROTEIN: BTB/POZ domain-containing protein At1g03010-like n=1 Tax=Phalaenopsis equestris TaxID=78828 RepID=UPI0009E5B64C|nr:LOW QUALITY PROTEIN: BTB/POZ domain-containing protein At1g03010-like [Phalaenopsis equestris]
MGVPTVAELKQNSSVKRAVRPSMNARHANEWPLTEFASDLTIEIGTSSFPLHKFPLVSRSGKIRKLLSESADPKPIRIHFQQIPGGAEAFELAAKFCYGISIEITLENVAMLRCAAHYLQMTEEFSERNLELRTELYIKESVITSIRNSITVLRHCETLLPVAEEINLVGRIIACITSNVCKEQLSSGLLKLDQSLHVKKMAAETEQASEWWGKSLAVLNLDFFQRVMSAIKSKGLKQDTVSKILINYAHSSLNGLILKDNRSSSDSEARKKSRIMVEAIVGLLPTQSRKSPVPMSFLSGLLKTAVMASASPVSKADLERRIGLQLDQAILEDILIPANSNGDGNNQLYDTDSVMRIFSIFLNLEGEEEEEEVHFRERDGSYEYDSPRSPKHSLLLRISKLMDSYLAEVSLDINLNASKFISLAELLPAHARLVTDGLYRAVDIFLKVHQNIKESERYRLCKAIDCQKLSQEACSHAAQNERLPIQMAGPRLPIQMAVQVLYFEQIRLRNAMNGSHDNLFFGPVNSKFPHRSGSGVGSGAISPRDNYASVRRENRELKLEVARMRMRLTDLEKDHVSMKQELVRANPANKILRSFAKKLNKLNSLFRLSAIRPLNPKTTHDARLLLHKRRRHSIS